MNFIDLVKKRTSIRKYLDKPIPRETLLRCVKAAQLAPSACNAQPWNFIIIDDKKTIKTVAEKICHTIYSFNKFISEAAALVVVVSDKESFLRKAAGKIKGTDYYLIDIGIACQHLILQAEELGIGSCWIGWFDQKRLKKTLKLSKKSKVDIIISLGYYHPEAANSKPRKPLAQIASFYKPEKT
ncbi:MAG: nitroreductase family protein [Candidatus Omnitrophota bacterium]